LERIWKETALIEVFSLHLRWCAGKAIDNAIRMASSPLQIRPTHHLNTGLQQYRCPRRCSSLCRLLQLEDHLNQILHSRIGASVLFSVGLKAVLAAGSQELRGLAPRCRLASAVRAVSAAGSQELRGLAPRCCVASAVRAVSAAGSQELRGLAPRCRLASA
jgi:hypothetical protein